MGLMPTGLRCEYLTNPLGIDTARPRLSWELQAGERGQRQTAYQVYVASSDRKLRDGWADLWDSGKVLSGQTLGIVYGGKPLPSGTRAYWRVRVWDERGKISYFSETAWWEMGLLQPDDWQAKWIDAGPAAAGEDPFGEHPAPLFRKEFRVTKEVRRARAYVSGLGLYELRLNGRRVGDQVLDPTWTETSKRVFYATHDVTALLQPGANTLGIEVGNGWYDPLPLRMWGHLNIREHVTVGRPRAILQLDVEYADGTRERIATDESWRTADGPILKNSLYLGEVYDARCELPGWDRPGFDDGAWRPAALAEEPVGPLRAPMLPPIRATRTVRPIGVSEPKPGVFIVDMGQNFAGWATLRVEGPAGTSVRLRYGELLNADGTLNGMTSVCGQIKQPRNQAPGAPIPAFQEDTYVLKGGGPEEYTPRFTWHGFRYVEITGFPGTPTLDTLEGHRLNSDVTPVGSFSCSNDLLNRIQEITLWTQLSNMFGVQSDCPHRERFGYGGDIVAASEMALYNFDMSAFYAKVVQDFADAVRPNGAFTETAPYVGIGDAGLGAGSGPVGWGTVHPLLLWQLYQHYGNRRLMEAQYPAAQRWLALLESKAKDGILDNGISDHESLVPKPRALTGTAFYYYNAVLMARIARALERPEDAERYTGLANSIRDAFNQRFLDVVTGRYDKGTQACQAFALFMGLVPEVKRDDALGVLVRDVLEEHGGHLTTGIFGTKYLLDALTEMGRADVAYTVAGQRTFPGWGHMLEHGATTLWEHWELSENTFSHNHPMFGSVSEWFYTALAGIQAYPDAVGFDRILIKPQVVGDLTWVKASHNTVRGPIAVEWRLEGETLTLSVAIPPNTTAVVFVPASEGAAVTEGGRPAARAPGVEHLGREEGAEVYRIGSGSYEFVAEGFRR